MAGIALRLWLTANGTWTTSRVAAVYFGSLGDELINNRYLHCYPSQNCNIGSRRWVRKAHQRVHGVPARWRTHLLNLL
jgi:hypothetical protein